MSQYDRLIKLELDKTGYLVEPCGIRFKRPKPVLSFNYDTTERGEDIKASYLVTPVLKLIHSGDLKFKIGSLELDGVNSFLVAGRKPIDKRRKTNNRRGPETEHLVERCIIDLYHIGA